MRYSSLFWYGFILLAILSNFGCGENFRAGPVQDPLVAGLVFSGKWQSTCTRGETFGVTQSTQVSFEPEQAVFTTKSGRESDCTIDDIEIKRTTRVIEKVAAGAPGVFRFSAEPVSIRVMPLTDIGLSTLRIREWCGIKDWVVGEERDITQAVREKSKNCLSPNDTTQKVVVRDGKLYFQAQNGALETLATESSYYVRAP